MHFNDILKLAARAWHEIKPAKDPEFNDCALTHREQLGAAAKAVVDSGQAFSHFDQAVLKLHLADQAAKSEADKILAENPTLHGDEVMHIASGVSHPLKNAMPGHAENMQMAAVREEFRGADVSGLEAPDIADQKSDVSDLKGPLPKDFPVHDLLHSAGINTYTQLIKQQNSEDGLEGIEGVGPATAEKIANRLAEDAQKEN